jgi:serine/threonine-protein phosphatase 2A regulatory subunit B
MTTLLRSFGTQINETTTEADIVSALAFDCSGDYVATGEVGGRISLFKRENKSSRLVEEKEMGVDECTRVGDKVSSDVWTTYFNFQSHVLDFDSLKSVEIPEKIRKIAFLPQILHSKFLLSTNERIIKLWKICEQSRWETPTTSSSSSSSSLSPPVQLVLPTRIRTAGKA